MAREPLTGEEVERRLNLIEQVLSGTSSSDEYLEAILYTLNTLVQLESGRGSTLGTRGGAVPDGTAGIAIDEIKETEEGTVLFKVDGRTVIAEVEAVREVPENEVVSYDSNQGGVIPQGDIDAAKLDFGEIATSTVKATVFEVAETEDTVTVEPGDTETVLDFNIEGGGSLLAVGNNDETYSNYIYEVDGNVLTSSPLTAPLGLYNDPYHFPQPLKVTNDVTLKVARDSDAPSSEEYYAKAIYFE